MQALSRLLFEETGIEAFDQSSRFFQVDDLIHSNRILIFGLGSETNVANMKFKSDEKGEIVESMRMLI